MMKSLSAALLLAVISAPMALPVQASDALPGIHALTLDQDMVERRRKRCPSGETPTTNPVCRGHGGGGI